MRRNLIAAFTFTLGTVFISTAIQAELFVYPEKGQSPEQQEQDEFACHKWAKQQTGIDPNEQVQAAAPPPKGGAVRGAAGGAALGAIGGAIAGDAGKGAAIGAGVGALGGAMKKRRGEKEQRQAVEAASAQQQQNQATFNRAYGACLAGRGYKVG